VLGSALLILPLMVLFLAVGTLLYFFHQLHPPEYPPPADLNHLVPHYIVREVPAGLRGFFMATLLAASLSSLTSALNALASITINDFYRPLRKRLRGGGREDEAEATHLLRASRFATFFWGGVLVLAALTFVGGDSNILAMALRALTYFYGALLGAFLLGIFTRRGSAWSVGSGMIVSIAAVVLLQARQFAAAPESAPSAVRAVVATLPEHLLEALTAGVPEIAWPYWIIIGTAVTFTVGLLGTRTCVVK
jgi:Na+/proline symporter